MTAQTEPAVLFEITDGVGSATARKCRRNAKIMRSISSIQEKETIDLAYIYTWPILLP
jgi:hypothetical protein